MLVGTFMLVGTIMLIGTFILVVHFMLGYTFMHVVGKWRAYIRPEIKKTMDR